MKVFAFAFRFFAVVMGLLTVGFSASVRGQVPVITPAESRGAPFALSVALDNDKIAVGEPIVLRYELHQIGGDTDKSIPLDQRVPWLQVRLLDTAGKEVSAVSLTSVQGLETNRWRLSGYLLTFPADGWKDKIVFGDKRLPVPVPGSYRVVVTASDLVSPVDDRLLRPNQGFGTRGGSLLAPVPLPLGPSYHRPIPIVADGGSVEQAAKLPTIRHSLRGSWSFPLTVRPDKGTVFHKALAARRLLQKGETGYPGSLQTLFSLYGQVARREQRAFIEEVRANPDQYSSPVLIETATMEAVAALGTPEALDFVAEEYWAHRPTPVVKPVMPGNTLNRVRFPPYFDNGIRQVLARWYASGDPYSRSRIKAIFDAHHEPVPVRIMNLDGAAVAAVGK